MHSDASLKWVPVPGVLTVMQMTLLPELPGKNPGVYFMTDGIRVKIGYTERQPRRRGGELKTEVIHFIPGDISTERREQHRWSHCHIVGEWFEAIPSFLIWLGINVDRTDGRAIAALKWLAANTEKRWAP
jgi:hypothetical protein